MRAIRASELGTYLYCKRAWWYQQNGEPSQNQAEMSGGTGFHPAHGGMETPLALFQNDRHRQRPFIGPHNQGGAVLILIQCHLELLAGLLLLAIVVIQALMIFCQTISILFQILPVFCKAAPILIQVLTVFRKAALLRF